MAHTMNEVAKLAGVSPATVSRVLSKSPYISKKTANRVLAAVEELHYHRNVHARRLAIGKSDLFGLVISQITNPFFSEVIRGFQSAAWDRGFDVLLLNTEYDEKRTESVIQKLIENDVRGAAIITSSLDDEVVSSLSAKGIAVVLCNPRPLDGPMSNIRINYERGLNQAIEHVAARGHRRAAVIAGPSTNKTAAGICESLVQGLRRRGLDPHPVTNCHYHFDAARSAVQLILAEKEQPTVIFCGSDLIAMGTMLTLEGEGIQVPRDISVIGIDDIPYASLSRPPLTTIGVPREQLGVTAFQALDKMLRLKKQKGTEYVLETELVVRQSTALRAGLEKSQAPLRLLR